MHVTISVVTLVAPQLKSTVTVVFAARKTGIGVVEGRPGIARLTDSTAG